MKPRHAAVGLLLAGLAHACATAGGRLTPEALNFVTDLLADAAQGAHIRTRVDGVHVVQRAKHGCLSRAFHVQVTHS